MQNNRILLFALSIGIVNIMYSSSLKNAFLSMPEENRMHCEQLQLQKAQKAKEDIQRQVQENINRSQKNFCEKLYCSNVVVGTNNNKIRVGADSDSAVIFSQICLLYPMKNDFAVKKEAQENEETRKNALLTAAQLLTPVSKLQGIDLGVVNLLNSLKN